jgi:hypothetical protein
MKAIKGIYEKGKIKLAEKPAEKGSLEVLVVFPEPDDDPWEQILKEPKPRPAFTKWIEEVEEEIAKGKTKPLRLKDL